MPQPILHLYLADSVAHHLRILKEPKHRNAFLHGAIAPDVGFFPGSHRQLSNLVHHWRTADMCRTLLGLATRDEERAFAWGWTTHMLADVLLHPTINGWCMAELDGQGTQAELLRLHVRLELGMDVMHVAAVKRAGVPTFRSTFDENTIGFLTRAYEDTYSLHVAPRPLLRAHRNMEGLCRRLLDLELLMAGAVTPDQPNAPHKLVMGALRSVAAVAGGSRLMATAFLDPVLPPLQLGLRLKERVDLFARRFSECVATDLRNLPNLDLDTGMEIPQHVRFAVA